MAKRGSIWNSPSKYGTYEGPRGNPSEWASSFDHTFSNSPTVKTIIHTSAFVTLGILPTASDEEIKRAYRNLAKLHHPDKGGDINTFQKITTAYNQALGNVEFFQTPVRSPKSKPQKTEVSDEDDDLIIPQLLTEIDFSNLDFYLNSDDYGCQEKKDGRHLTLQIKNLQLIVRNKQGKKSNCAPEFESDLRAIGHNILLDGEQIGTTFHVWDILEYDNEDLRNKSFLDRDFFLNQLHFGNSIKIVPLIISKQEKLAFFNKMKTEKREGIVFKKLSAIFSPGKGIDQFKYKFYAECSVIVTEGRPGKSSIGMELIGSNGREFVGYCTCVLKPLPPVNSIAEIKYLYAYKGGCLYQSSFKELRDDVDINECTLSQLKYKSES